jgi:hypothetical protein
VLYCLKENINLKEMNFREYVERYGEHRQETSQSTQPKLHETVAVKLDNKPIRQNENRVS